MRLYAFSLSLAVAAFSTLAAADMVRVEVTNNQPAGGFSVTPLWFAFHDGTFNAFDDNAAASPGIERLAELGDPSVLAIEFANSGANGVAGVLGSPNREELLATITIIPEPSAALLLLLAAGIVLQRMRR
ncbi:MAG: spondin domain-containing protein [Planctomycetota bacterium]